MQLEAHADEGWGSRAVDGAEGGTGAAPAEFIDHVGVPMHEALMLVHNTLVGLDLRDRIRFPHSGEAPPAPTLGLREHALVAIGGGKDSLVSIEALRSAGVAQTVAWVGASQLISACAARTISALPP